MLDLAHLFVNQKLKWLISSFNFAFQLKDEAHKLENATAPADQVISDLIHTLLQQDPSLSYHGFMDIKDLYVKRFIRLRKDFLAKHSLPSTMNLKKIVMRSKKVLKGRNLLFKPIIKPDGTISIGKPRAQTPSAHSSSIASKVPNPDESETSFDQSPDQSIEQVPDSVSQAVSSILDIPQRIQAESISPTKIAAAVSSIEPVERVVVTTADGLFPVPQHHYETSAQIHFAEGDQQVIIVKQPPIEDQEESVE